MLYTIIFWVLRSRGCETPCTYFNNSPLGQSLTMIQMDSGVILYYATASIVSALQLCVHTDERVSHGGGESDRLAACRYSFHPEHDHSYHAGPGSACIPDNRRANYPPCDRARCLNGKNSDFRILQGRERRV